MSETTDDGNLVFRDPDSSAFVVITSSNMSPEVLSHRWWAHSDEFKLTCSTCDLDWTPDQPMASIPFCGGSGPEEDE